MVRWPVCWKPGARALGLTGLIENEPWASSPGVSLEPALKQLASHLVRLRLAGKTSIVSDKRTDKMTYVDVEVQKIGEQTKSNIGQ